MYQTDPADTAENSHRLVLLLTVLFVPLLFFAGFGYDYASSDQDELLGLAIHQADATLLAKDWVITEVSSRANVRAAVVWLISWGTKIVPLWTVILGFYLLSWGLLVSGVFELARYFSASSMTGAIASAVALVATRHWTLGGNDLAALMFVPSMPAWGAALLGFVALLRRHHVRAGTLLGAAAILQPLVGLQILSVCLFVSIARRDSLSSLAQTAGGFAIIALPLLLPIIITQATSSGSSPEETWRILAVFRHPHHYLPSAASAGRLLRFGLLFVAGSFLLFKPRGRPQNERIRDFRAAFAGVTLAVVLGGVLSEAVPVLAVAKLQPLKLTVFLKVVAVIVIADSATTFGTRLVSAGGRRPEVPQERRLVLLHRAVFAGFVAYVLVAAGILLNVDPFLKRVSPLARADEPDILAADWARAHTPVTALFAVPPSNSTFRSNARRSVVVTFKGVPFAPSALLEWYRRIVDVSGTSGPDPPSRDVGHLMAVLDQSYESRTASDLRALQRRYGFDYVVRTSPLVDTAADVTEVFRADSVRVYRFETASASP